MPLPHTFYDDNTLLDLRFLIAAEAFEFDEEEEATPYGIGCLLEVGHTPQRLSFQYPTRQQRDSAFQRLIAMHQAWDHFLHAEHEHEE